MDLECAQIMLKTSNVQQARDFYAGMLEFPVVEEHPGMFAFKAGQVRFTVVGGGTLLADEPDPEPNATIMMRTADLEATVKTLKAKGVSFLDEIQEAPGFMKHIALVDPDNNLLFFGQYYRDPLQPA